MTHTPGPWEINRDFRTSINAGPKHIAMVGYFHSGDERDVSGEEHEGNVLLIHAASDLLAACEMGDGFLTGPQLLRLVAYWLEASGVAIAPVPGILRAKADAEEAAIKKARET